MTAATASSTEAEPWPRPHWDRVRSLWPWALLGGAALVVFLALTAVVLSADSRGQLAWDASAARWFAVERTATQGDVGLGYADATSPAVLVGLVVVIAAVLFWRMLRLQALVLLGATFLAYACGAVAKFGVDRVRPQAPINLAPETEPSFPSGHVLVVTTIALVALGLAWGYLGRTGRVIGSLLAALWIVLTCIDRLVVGAHWLTDVLASLALALVVVSVSLAAYQLLRPSEPAGTTA